MSQLFPAISTSRYRVKHYLREVHIITEFRDGCAYRTRSLGMLSCTPEYADMLRALPNIHVGSIPTWVSHAISK